MQGDIGCGLRYALPEISGWLDVLFFLDFAGEECNDHIYRMGFAVIGSSCVWGSGQLDLSDKCSVIVFLYGIIEEEAYVEPPGDLEDGVPRAIATVSRSANHPPNTWDTD